MNVNFSLDDAIDEDFFGSLEGKSSKLQELFLDDVLSAEDKQQTLKYQRPKASDFKAKKVNEDPSSNNASSTTLMAKVVHAFRQGESQGKVGLALIQNPNDTFAIIMYKTKANILTNLILESNKLYKQLKYWQFYDNHNLYWSFSFDTPQDEKEFVERLNSNKIEYKETQENTKSSEVERKEAVVEQLDENFGQINTPSLSNETNNSLIQRMAKMGKPLPLLPANNKPPISTDYSDSSDTEVLNAPLSSNQRPAITPRSSKLSSIKANQQLVASTIAVHPTSSAIYPLNPLESQYMQMLLTEQRTQGSELRMNMNKLENKIEKVLDKLDLYDKRTDSKQKPEKDDEILELEEKLLMLKKENRKLKQALEEKSNENKLNDIFQDLQTDLKEFNINPDNDFQESIKQLMRTLRENIKEKQFTEQKLKDSENSIKDLQKDLERNAMKLEDVQQHLDTLKVNEETLKRHLCEKDKEIEEKNEQILNLQKDLQEINPNYMNNTVTENVVKTIMNGLYADICDKMDKSNLSQKEQILSLIATSIRKQTLDVLKQTSFREN